MEHVQPCAPQGTHSAFQYYAGLKAANGSYAPTFRTIYTISLPITSLLHVLDNEL